VPYAPPIVSVAGNCGAEVLYSEELTDGHSCGEVRVVKPLK